MPSVPDNDLAFAQYTAVRDQIHDAFDRVALGLSCTLPMLLEETRSRGIPDDNVRHVMVMDEVDAQAGEDSDRHFRCARSNAGVLYITRDTAPPNAAALAFEAFAELWRDTQGRRSET